jgi:septal ring factor EnvC (AmiA/AmiB activator)
MKPRTLLAAAAVLFAALAQPLRAQDAATGGIQPAPSASADSLRPVHVAPVVITAERPDDRERLLRLERGNRFLAHELKKYDRRVAVLESHLGALRERAARGEAEIGALQAQRQAVRAERERLEARLVAAEQSQPSRPVTSSAGRSGGS